MKTLETERLILRRFTESDFSAVHRYASCTENVVYMVWGPNSEEETRAFIIKYRGNGYAVRACHLLKPVAKAHKMIKLLITNEHTNAASRRVCEKLGARLIRVARLPEWSELYKKDYRFVNIFEWSVM